MYFLNLYFHTSPKTRLNAKTGHSLFAPLAQFPLLKGLTQLKSHPGQTGIIFMFCVIWLSLCGSTLLFGIGWYLL